MNAIDFIKTTIATSRGMTTQLIMDLKDEPVAQPTTKGGNHALWILGHLAYSESSLLHCMIMGKEKCPLNHLKDLFDYNNEPKADASIYPSFDSLLADYESARKDTLEYLDSITDADLDDAAPGCPDEWKEFFGTKGLCFTFIAIHPSLHSGQLADTRRALGRAPLMA